MPLHEIIYVSFASEMFSDAQLNELLERSRTKNHQNGITGTLIYYRREFMQLFEGEHDQVVELYEKVLRDPRHQQVHQLWEAPIERRNFSEWTMAYLSPDASGLPKREAYNAMLEDGLIKSTRDSTGKKFLLNLRDDFLHKD
jgi:hypothetical protein